MAEKTDSSDKPSVPTWKWKPFPSKTYGAEIARGVHLSIKGINTNATPCGVRLGAGSGRRLPYVSLVRAIADGHRFPLDYTANRGSVATVFKQAANIAGWESTLPHREAPHEEQEAIKAAVKKAFATDYVEEDTAKPISPRARQLLFPDGNGGYVSLIPLAAPVFAGHLKDRWFAYIKSLPDDAAARRRAHWVRFAYMGFGGANPQNAGRLIRQMQAPFLFRGPTEDPMIRRAYALHFRGVSLRLPRDRMESYRDWRHSFSNGRRVPTDMQLRQEEAKHVKAIGRALLERGEWAHALLQRYRDYLPIPADANTLVASEADPAARGLTDPAWRDQEWPRRFAETVAHHIGNYLFPDGTTLGLDAPALRELAHWLEEEARA